MVGVEEEGSEKVVPDGQPVVEGEQFLVVLVELLAALTDVDDLVYLEVQAFDLFLEVFIGGADDDVTD